MPCPAIDPKWQSKSSGKNCFEGVQIILVRFKLDFSGLICMIWTWPNKLDLVLNQNSLGRSKIISDPRMTRHKQSTVYLKMLLCRNFSLKLQWRKYLVLQQTLNFVKLRIKVSRACKLWPILMNFVQILWFS